jgi:N-acetylglucosamine-6-phosphate deacetylase
MASSTPAAFLGMAGQRGSIKAGQRADFVILDGDYRARSTIIEGQTDR